MSDCAIDALRKSDVMFFIEDVDITNEYRYALSGVTTWMFNDTMVMQDNTLKTAKNFMDEAKNRLAKARKSATQDDLDTFDVDSFENILLNRFKGLLIRTIEGKADKITL